ncbi:spondin domain-containing protein [Alteromonas gilva]|uniref:Spondin domain-containing protein n=1 Tax=Alteromonas gilva TaxID=2987522 RepID=A0ABT5KZ65_9ALTE|nr:spondin domain-containing protein [Alteromonas gilva]MDC8830054.1 spondin domain-containing protein [Alteromonas gilva]
MLLQQRLSLSAIGLSCLALGACSDSNNPSQPVPEPAPVSYSYDITVQNLTKGQPLSPVGIALHDDRTLWTLGEAASVALEVLAEGGDNSDFIGDESFYATVSGAQPIGPGMSDTLTVTVTDQAESFISVATMFVNTNDAFAGVSGHALADLALNGSMTVLLPVLDAGTEANSEAAGTIPGPADGGEGFNSARDDADVVSFHPGVVSAQDGLTMSVLTSAHRFDNPAVKVTITRVQ